MKTGNSSFTALVLTSLVWLSACDEAQVPSAPQTAAERGRAVAAAKACTACHTLDGTRGIGPSWAGLYGTTRVLKSGERVLADAAYLRRALLEPAAEVVEGYDSIMVPAAVSEQELADIIALIKELADSPTP